jgi:nucleoside-diphosphate-sugar epimerase
MDVGFAAPPADPRVRQLPGSIADAALRCQGYEGGVDAVFHLASIRAVRPKNYALGRSINLDATLGLLEDLRGVRRRGACRASSSPAPWPSTASTCRRWWTSRPCPTPA